MQNDEFTPDLEQDETNNQEVEVENYSDDTTEDTIDWKAEAERLRAENAKQRAILERNKNKITDKPATKQKSNDLGYAEKAYLLGNGIKGGDEVALVQNVMRETGKSLEEVIESKYFLAELNEIRELKKTDNASISNSRKSSQSPSDTVEYWIAKGELPPTTNQELRQKVVNARLKRDSSKSPFYNA